MPSVVADVKGTVARVSISDADKLEISHGLSQLLAETYVLYLKTHYFHFQTLYVMLKEQYTDLSHALEQIAERIQTLGVLAHERYRNFEEVVPPTGETEASAADEIIHALLEGHERAVFTARAVLRKAESVGDSLTVDLLTQRAESHEMTATVLKSLLL